MRSAGRWKGSRGLLWSIGVDIVATLGAMVRDTRVLYILDESFAYHKAEIALPDGEARQWVTGDLVKRRHSMSAMSFTGLGTRAPVTSSTTRYTDIDVVGFFAEPHTRRVMEN